jgi:hypothetical protein
MVNSAPSSPEMTDNRSEAVSQLLLLLPDSARLLPLAEDCNGDDEGG